MWNCCIFSNFIFPIETTQIMGRRTLRSDYIPGICNHRTIRFENVWEETLKIILFQSPCHRQG